MQDSSASRSLGPAPKYRYRHGDLPAIVGLGGGATLGGASTCWSARTPTPNQWAREKALRGAPLSARLDYSLEVRPPSSGVGLLGGSFRAKSAFHDYDAMAANALRGDAAAQTDLDGGKTALALPTIGGRPRTVRSLKTAPAKMAAPIVRPHNAWFAVVQWVPPVDGEADVDFRYDLNLMSEGADRPILIADLGQDPWVQLSGLAHASTHYFQVRARNASGVSEWSNWSEGYTVPEATDLPAASLAKASVSSDRPAETWSPPPFPTSTSDQTTSAMLEWEEPCSHGSNIVGYKLQYGLDPQDTESITTIVLTTRKTSTQVSDLIPNRVYYFRVQALNEVGHSGWTAWSDGIATRAVPPEQPPAPTLKEAKAKELLIQWSAPASCGFGAERYNIRVAREDPTMTKTVELEGARATAADCMLRITDLEPNTSYYFQVRAISAVGVSPWSGVSDALKTGSAVPDICKAPRILHNEAVYSDGRTTSSISLEWIVPNGRGLPVDRFQLRWASDPRMRDEIDRKEICAPADCIEGSVVNGTAEGILPGSRVYFAVAAANSVGYGKLSSGSDDVIAAIAPPERPEPPTVIERTTRSILVEVVDTVRNNGSEVLRYELRWDKASDMKNPMYCRDCMTLVGGTDLGSTITSLSSDMLRPLHPASAGKGSPPAGRNRIKKKPRRFQAPVVGLRERGPYFFSVRAINAIGHSAWSAPSDATNLVSHVPGAMPAPVLREVHHHRLVITYQHSSDARPTADTGVSYYELRYAHSTKEFELDVAADESWLLCETKMVEDSPGRFTEQTVVTSSVDDCKWQPVRCLRWDAPPMIPRQPPPPVRVDGLQAGRPYVFQMRALAANGALSPWSEASVPCFTPALIPDKPEAIIQGPTIHSTYIEIAMTLPEFNGKPIKFARLKMIGPVWKNRPAPEEWEELLCVDTSNVDRVEKIPRSPTQEERATLSTPDFVEKWHYTIACLEPGASYQFKFAVANEVGLSEWSDPSSPAFTTAELPHRCKPPTVEPDEETGVGTNHIHLQWRAPHDGGTDIQKYTLKWATNSHFDDCKVIDDIPETRITLKDLSPYRWYYFQVRATTLVGCAMEFSEVIKAQGIGCVRTKPTVPGPPKGPVTATIVVDGKTSCVRVNWGGPLQDGGRQVTRYRIAYSESPEMNDCVEIIHKASRERIFRGLKPETVYYFDVAASNSVGYGARTGEPAQVQTPALPEAARLLPKKPAPPTFEADSKDDPMNRLPSAQGGKRRSSVTPGNQGRRGSFTSAGGVLPPAPVAKNGKIVFRWICAEEYHKTRGFIYDEETQTHMVLSHSVRVLVFQEEPTLPAGVYERTRTAELDESTVEEIKEFVVDQTRDRRDCPKDETNYVTLESLPGRWYYAQVQAKNEVGCSAWSFFSEPIRAACGVPEKVDDILLVSQTEDSLEVQWESPFGNGDPVFMFRVRWRKEAETDFATESFKDVHLAHVARNPRRTSATNVVTKCTYTIEGLRHATHYVVEVLAINCTGPGPWCTSKAFRTSSTIPSAPSLARGKPGSATPDGVSFIWDPPDDDGGEPILGYLVRWALLPAGVQLLSSEFEAKLLGENVAHDAKQTEVTAEEREVRATAADGLRPGDAAIPTIRARTCMGCGPWSRLPEPLSPVLESLATLPTTPSPLAQAPILFQEGAVDSIRPYSLAAKWNCPALNGRPVRCFQLLLKPCIEDGHNEKLTPMNPAGVRQKKPERKMPDAVSSTLILEHPKGEKLWEEGQLISFQGLHAGLTAGIHYRLQVRACSELGEAVDPGPASEPQMSPPDLPEQPEAPTCPWQWPTGFEVNWEEPYMSGAPIQDFEARFGQDSTMNKFEMVPLGSDRHSSRQFKIENLECLTGYFVQFRVRNSLGWSIWSPVSKRCVTTTTRPKAPFVLEMHEVTSFTMHARWDEAEDHGSPVTHYELIFVEGPQAIAELQEAIDTCNAMPPDESMREQVFTNLKMRARCKITTPDAEAFREEITKQGSAAILSHRFEELFGGLSFDIAVRAQNSEGWSDWSKLLAPVWTLPTTPSQCPMMTCLDTGTTTLRVQYELPYDNGDRILGVFIRCVRIIGPRDRSRRPGDSSNNGGGSKKLGDGEVVATQVFDVPLPTPEPARAPPGGCGGTGDYTIVGLEFGTEYEVSVCAKNSKGSGEYSLAIRVICLPGPPDPPGTVKHVKTQSDPALAESAAPKSICVGDLR